jgi:hypothetical protein
MLEWQTRRTTAALAIAGAILTLVFNALHPHPSDPTPEAFLRLVAAHPYWVTLHLGLSLGVLLIVGGLAGLTDALRETAGAHLARFGFLTVLLGASLFLVNFAIDGIAMQGIARAWTEAAPAEQATALRVADALDRANFGLYTFETLLLPGLPFVLYGLAVVRSGSYPRLLGWVGVLGGSVSSAAGLLQAYTGRSPLASVLFVSGSMLVTLWMLMLGVAMWRLAGRSSTAVEPAALVGRGRQSRKETGLPHLTA